MSDDGVVQICGDCAGMKRKMVYWRDRAEKAEERNKALADSIGKAGLQLELAGNDWEEDRDAKAIKRIRAAWDELSGVLLSARVGPTNHVDVLPVKR